MVVLFLPNSVIHAWVHGSAGLLAELLLTGFSIFIVCVYTMTHACIAEFSENKIVKTVV